MALRRKHPVLLAAVVTMLVAQPLLAHGGPPRRILHDAMFAVVLVSLFFIVFGQRWERKLALALIIPALAVYAAYSVLPDRLRLPSLVAYHGSVIAFIAFAVAVILRDIFRKRAIGGDDVLGAVSGYLLAGVVWGNLYLMLHLFVPSSFAVQPEIAWQLHEWHLRHALFNYFSFTTLTTLNYNDITPAAPFADTLTWLEVVFGQFYMAVVVAQLVGMRLAQAITPDSPPPK